MLSDGITGVLASPAWESGNPMLRLEPSTENCTASGRTAVPWSSGELGPGGRGPPLLCPLTPFLHALPLDPSTVQDRCEKACRPEEECVFVNGTWGCFCRQSLNSSGERRGRRRPGAGGGGVQVSAGSAELRERELPQPGGLQGWEGGMPHVSRSAAGPQPPEAALAWAGLTHGGRRS